MFDVSILFRVSGVIITLYDELGQNQAYSNMTPKCDSHPEVPLKKDSLA